MSTAPARTRLSAFDRNRVLLAVGASAVLGASYLLAPWVGHGPVLCPFRLVTGLPCPGCGLTRAFAALAHGHLLQALSFNAFGVPLFLLTVLALPIALAELLLGRPLPGYGFLYSRRFATIVAVLLVGYHVARCIVWFSDGTLMHEYVQSSWIYSLLRFAGLTGRG